MGKRTSDCARTWRRPVEILCPPSLLCTGHRCAAIQRHLRPAPRGWYCYVKVAGSAMPSTLHEYKSLRWKAREIEVALH